MRRDSNCRLILSLLVALVLLGGWAPAWGVDPSPLERHIRGLKSAIVRLSAHSFTRKLPNGQVESFRVTQGGYRFVRLDRGGNKVLEWTRKGRNQVSYEAWYAYPRSRERLLEDDRNISYTSFYSNGQKWEQYSFNKQKKLKSYYVYDKQGRLVH